MGSKKRVICFIDTLGPGGAQRQLVGLATFLKEKGFWVTVACYHDIRFYLDQLQNKDIPYVYLEKANSSLFRIWYISRFIQKTKPDVVISYLETPSICACIAKFFNRSFKLIVSERNTTQQTRLNERIRFALFRYANWVVPNSYSQEIYIKKRFPRLSNKIVTIPNFVDLDYFTPVYKKQHDIPEIMVAASIWASKNTLGFIDAVAQLKKKGRKFHISWYGKSETNIDYYNQCQERIKKLGVNDYISLKEKTTRIKECYQEADFFCLPSFYEGTPNVICEAMACALPIICSDVCDNRKYVAEGENGYLFNPHKPDTICKSIIRMMNLSEQEYAYFCKNSRTIAEDNLSKDTFVNSYIKLIES